MPYADPDKARNYLREYRRVQRTAEGCTTGCTSHVPPSFRLETAADGLAMLAEQVEAVRKDRKAKTLQKARPIGYLAAITIKAIEAGNLAARIEGLEERTEDKSEARREFLIKLAQTLDPWPKAKVVVGDLLEKQIERNQQKAMKEPVK